MKQLVASSIIAALMFMSCFAADAQTGSLSVIVEGISSATGKIMMAVFKDADGFPSEPQKAFQLQQLPATKGNHVINLNGLPNGKYALALYHDQNNDNQLNTNIFGAPKEGYGFSNNVKPVFSAPGFGEASFVVDGKKQIKISMRY